MNYLRASVGSVKRFLLGYTVLDSRLNMVTLFIIGKIATQ
jgi:hypothetical protein